VALALVLAAWAGFAPLAHGQSTKVNVNTADAKTLATLPGVGPATAQRIIDGRPYHSLADLEKVNGLSQAKVDALKGKVSFTMPKAKKSSATATTAQESSTTAPKPASSTSDASTPARHTSTSDTSSSVSHSGGSATASAASKLAPGEKININTASAAELDRLPGIGKTKAQAIIDYRTQNGRFTSLEDIQKVKGIKAGEFNKLKDYIKL
jgi:competence protein ComEA